MGQPIAQILALQTKRITELRNAVDQLNAKVQANGDSIDRLHRTITDGDTQ